MAIGDIIVGIDIGTSKVSSVIAEINNFNQLEILATAEQKCFGIKKSQITDEDEIASAIGKTISVKEAKDRFVGITSKDVNSAMFQIKDIEVPEDKVVIDVIKNQFVLDNGRIVEDPVGALSSTVTLTGQVILADRSYVRQLTSIFKKVNIEIDGIIPNVVAQRSLILDVNELNDNIAWW